MGKGVAALTKEREALETSVLDMAGKTQAIDRWLTENEAKIPEGELAGEGVRTVQIHPLYPICCRSS